MHNLPTKFLIKFFRKLISVFLVTFFSLYSIVTPAGATILPDMLPVPGTMVGLSGIYEPPVLLGLKIHPENPLLFDFIVDRGQTELSAEDLKSETEKLVKFFLAALTIPDKEAWVNLSPYEKDRIIPDVLGRTEMGKQMLEQDYILKQLSSSLTNPETDLGEKYWKEVEKREALSVKREANETDASHFTNDASRSSFTKVWIVPGKAKVLESDGIVLIDDRRLKVMMDEDYVAMEQSTVDSGKSMVKINETTDHRQQTTHLSSDIFRQTILPKLEAEVNEGKNFAAVRQVYNSVILAAWYKQALKNSLLGQVYADKGKVIGVEINDPDILKNCQGVGTPTEQSECRGKDMKQRVYEQYLSAFKKGVYSVIKEEEDALTGDLIPRKYFSGGTELSFSATGSSPLGVSKVSSSAIGDFFNKKLSTLTEGAKRIFSARISAEEKDANAAMVDRLAASLREDSESTTPSQLAPQDREAEVRKLVAEETEIALKSLLQDPDFARINPDITSRPLLVVMQAMIYSAYAMKITNSMENLANQLANKDSVELVLFENAPSPGAAQGGFMVLSQDYLQQFENALRVLNNTQILTPYRGTLRSSFGFEVQGPLTVPGVFADMVEQAAQRVYDATASSSAVENRTNAEPLKIVELIRQNETVPFVNTREFPMVSGPYFDLFEEKYGGIIMPSARSNILVVGGTRDEVDFLFNRYPQAKITVINLDLQTLRLIESGYQERGRGRLELYLANAENLDPQRFPSGSYDLIYASGIEIDTFGGVNNARAMLTNIISEEVRLLKPGGVMYHLALKDGFPENEELLEYLSPEQRDQMSWIDLKMPVGNAFYRKSDASEAPKQSSSAVGGIDFDPTNLNLEIKRNGKGVPLPLPQQNLEQINIEGLYPVIINIMPVNPQTLPLFLGKTTEPAEIQEAHSLKNSS